MKITFSDRYPSMELTGKKDGGRPTVRLLEDVTVVIEDGTRLYKILIPKGFIFDGASAPWGLWNILNPLDPDVFPAALLHDWIYRTEYFPRAKCDEMFYQAMRQCGNGVIVSNRNWFFLRSCGWNAWRKHTKKSVADVRRLAGIYGEERPLLNC